MVAAKRTAFLLSNGMLRDQGLTKSGARRPIAYALEPRLLFDGAAIADATNAIVYRDAASDAASNNTLAPQEIFLSATKTLRIKAKTLK